MDVFVDAEQLKSRRHPSSSRLGELLIRSATISNKDLALALAEQDLDARSEPIGRLLVRLGVIDEVTLTLALAEQSGLPLIDLDERIPSPAAVARLAREAAFRLQALPVDFVDSHLLVAVSEPMDRHRHRQVVQGTGRAVEFALAPAPVLLRALDQCYPHPSDVDAGRAPIAPGPVLNLAPKSGAAPNPASDDAGQQSASEDRVVTWFAEQIRATGARLVRLVPAPTHLRIEFTAPPSTRKSLTIPPQAGTILIQRLVRASGLDATARAVRHGTLSLSTPGSDATLSIIATDEGIVSVAVAVNDT